MTQYVTNPSQLNGNWWNTNRFNPNERKAT
jgi:hypothetical protein